MLKKKNNQFRNYTFLLLTLFLVHCSKEETKDPCEGIVCVPQKNCVDGTCTCPDKRYDGTFCENQVTPTTLHISSIKVIRLPAKKMNGDAWDSLSSPDIHITLYQAANSVWQSKQTMIDVDTSAVIQLSLDSNIRITNLESLHTFSMYDDDGNKVDEFMGGVVFTPYSKTGNFPTTLTIDTGGLLAFEIGLVYTF